MKKSFKDTTRALKLKSRLAYERWLGEKLPKGEQFPFEGNAIEFTSKNVIAREKAERRAQTVADIMAEQIRSGVQLEEVHVEVARPGFGIQAVDSRYQRPQLQPGKIYLGWGDPFTYRNMMNRARRSSRTKEELKTRTLLAYADFMNDNMRIAKFQDSTVHHAKATGIAPDLVERVQLSQAEQNEIKFNPIDWDVEAGNTLVVEVSEIAQEAKEVPVIKGKKIIQKREPGIQVFNPATGRSMYKEVTAARQFAGKNSSDQYKVVADALKKIQADNPNKAIVVQYVDPTMSGKHGKKLERLLGVQSFPIVAQSQSYSHTQTGKRSSGIGKKALIGATGLALIYGAVVGVKKLPPIDFSSPIGQEESAPTYEPTPKPEPTSTYTPEPKRKSKPTPRPTRKPTRKPTPKSTSKNNLDGRITDFRHKPKRWSSEKIYLTVDVNDPDGISEISARFKIKENDYEEFTLTEYNKGEEPKEVQEEFYVEPKDTRLKYNTNYGIDLEVLDAKGNKEDTGAIMRQWEE